MPLRWDGRGSARLRGYTAQWDKAAATFRQQHPLCLGCSAVGDVEAAQLVDHVVPHKGNAVVFWDRTLWQPACRFHHDVVKQQLEAMYARGSIVAADLWLTSKVAIAITKRERSSVGLDGWPVER
jgi:5-methylcytosine-specific restriction protein A